MDNFPTEGSVDICGLPLSNSESKLLIGYCPQTDPILELLNSYETLFFFGRIRGIKESVLTKRVNELILQVGLSKHASRLCGTYSGGNKVNHHHHHLYYDYHYHYYNRENYHLQLH